MNGLEQMINIRGGLWAAGFDDTLINLILWWANSNCDANKNNAEM